MIKTLLDKVYLDTSKKIFRGDCTLHLYLRGYRNEGERLTPYL
jgi:hypothetical protein